MAVRLPQIWKFIGVTVTTISYIQRVSIDVQIGSILEHQGFTR